MVAAGNDFIVIQLPLPVDIALNKLARTACDRKYGIGADGALFLGPSRKADARMRIFNPDGSEAEMCGNGLRCLARYYQDLQLRPKAGITIETKAGLIPAQVDRDNVKARLTDPRGIKLDIPLKVGRRALKVNFINTGVPHAVIFVESLGGIDVAGIGRRIRYHRNFLPRGTNVDFVEVRDKRSVSLRTYERGVEGETLACGTGAAAAAVIFALKAGLRAGRVNVHTHSAEALKVSFLSSGNAVSDVWLEGKARHLFEGGLYV